MIHLDPFLIITSANDGRLITKTEFIKQNLNPEWQPFVISLSDVSNNLMCMHFPSLFLFIG